jgi:hypothetical protein
LTVAKGHPDGPDLRSGEDGSAHLVLVTKNHILSAVRPLSDRTWIFSDSPPRQPSYELLTGALNAR